VAKSFSAISGLKKVLSSPGQVDCLSCSASNFKVTCPMGKGSGKSSCNLIINYDKQAMAPKAAKSEKCWSKGQAGNPVFLSLENGLLF